MLCYDCAKELDPNRLIKRGKLIRCEKCKRYSCAAEITHYETTTSISSGPSMGKSDWIQARQIGKTNMTMRNIK